MLRCILLLTVVLPSLGMTTPDNRQPVAEDNKGPWTVRVLVVHYFPLTPDKKNIDIKVTSNVGAPLEEIKKKCERMTKETLAALEEGSRHHAYKNPEARPSLKYEVVDSLTFHEAVPAHRNKKNYND